MLGQFNRLKTNPSQAPLQGTAVSLPNTHTHSTHTQTCLYVPPNRNPLFLHMAAVSEWDTSMTRPVFFWPFSLQHSLRKVGATTGTCTNQPLIKQTATQQICVKQEIPQQFCQTPLIKLERKTREECFLWTLWWLSSTPLYQVSSFIPSSRHVHPEQSSALPPPEYLLYSLSPLQREGWKYSFWASVWICVKWHSDLNYYSK